jgi:hypothetical protein
MQLKSAVDFNPTITFIHSYHEGTIVTHEIANRTFACPMVEDGIRGRPRYKIPAIRAHWSDRSANLEFIQELRLE